MFRASRNLEVMGAAVLLLLTQVAGAQQNNRQTRAGKIRFSIATDTLPQPLAHTPYHFQLVAQGGTPPYTWNIEKGKLPLGLQLDPHTGVIAGVPEHAAAPALTVRVTDSAQPPVSALRELRFTSVPALQMEWQRRPALENDGIYGEVKVANPSKDAYDLTFIIVAINEIGKAFALGYQHFNLQPKAEQAIPFGSSLPLGTYVVHADAVGEVASKDVIRRAQLETPEPLVRK